MHFLAVYYEIRVVRNIVTKFVPHGDCESLRMARKSKEV